jgi:hypothetical protein
MIDYADVTAYVGINEARSAGERKGSEFSIRLPTVLEKMY